LLRDRQQRFDSTVERPLAATSLYAVWFTLYAARTRPSTIVSIDRSVVALAMLAACFREDRRIDSVAVVNFLELTATSGGATAAEEICANATAGKHSFTRRPPSVFDGYFTASIRK